MRTVRSLRERLAAWKAGRRLGAVLGVLAVLGACWVAWPWASRPGAGHGRPGPGHAAAPSPTGDGTPAPVATPPAGDSGPLPRELRIPSLGIRGAVLPVGLDRDGNMDVTPTASTVGWYRLGPAPGQDGDAVLECHNQWYGAPRALCSDLHAVAVGADVYTSSADGGSRHWTVDRVQRVGYAARMPGLFSPAGPPRLSIVTCDGRWDPALGTYAFRIVVDARLAG